MKTKFKNKPKTQEEVTLEDLTNVKEVFDKHNIKFWLDCGILLGAVREQRFIPWDNDIDLGAWEKDVDKIIAACIELQDRGFIIQLDRCGIGIKKTTSFVPFSVLFYRLTNSKAIKRWGGNNVPSKMLQRFVNGLFWMLSTPHYSGINPKDLHGIKNSIILSLVNIGRVFPDFIKKWVAKIELKKGPRYISIIPAYHFINLSTIEFYGMEFKVPSRTEEYLTYRYGKDWRVPKRDWNGAKSDGTIFKFN